MQVQLQQGTWQIGECIGSGGFGKVFEAWNADVVQAAAKFIPKAPGAERELLFADRKNARNVMPILDRGETSNDWVLVMPRALKSLRQHMDRLGGILDVAASLRILRDIATALADLDGEVVHRDLKPENVLWLNEQWQLTDFGISRYAEATTSPNTQKYSLSPPYAAPERWRSERATIATDIYSFGIIAYEILSGHRPFSGDMDQLRDAHLHQSAPHLNTAPAALAALVEECLFKAPQARPDPADVLLRIERAAQQPVSPGLAALQEANRGEAIRNGERHRAATAAQSEKERRNDLLQAAKTSFSRISAALKETLLDAAPAANVKDTDGGWTMSLGSATLRITKPALTAQEPWGGWNPPAFDVVAHANIDIRIPATPHGYEGREHSLWFCDASPSGAGNYRWFETAFMISPFRNLQARQNPFGLDPGIEAAKAVWNGIAEFQLAWPFEPLVAGDLDEFIGRWAGWFALAAQGQLNHPSSMPERRPEGSFRQS